MHYRNAFVRRGPVFKWPLVSGSIASIRRPVDQSCFDIHRSLLFFSLIVQTERRKNFEREKEWSCAVNERRMEEMWVVLFVVVGVALVSAIENDWRHQRLGRFFGEVGRFRIFYSQQVGCFPTSVSVRRRCRLSGRHKWSQVSSSQEGGTFLPHPHRLLCCPAGNRDTMTARRGIATMLQERLGVTGRKSGWGPGRGPLFPH